MTPQQCRAARALLGLDQTSLAARAGLGLSTVVDFERSRREVLAETVRYIRYALEDAGIGFIGRNGVMLKAE